MKTTLDLPTDLLTDIKLHASNAGVDLDDAAADLLRKGLATTGFPSLRAPRPVFKKHPQTGLPYIECSSDAPASRLTVAELAAIEGEALAQLDIEHCSDSA